MIIVMILYNRMPKLQPKLALFTPGILWYNARAIPHKSTAALPKKSFPRRHPMEQLTMHIIANIHSDFPTKFGIPRQSGLVEELTA